jgi:hypothetical protein
MTDLLGGSQNFAIVPAAHAKGHKGFTPEGAEREA